MTDVARIERIEQLTAEAATEFAQPITSDLVQLIGALRFAREEMLDRLATGARNPEQISAALIDNGNAIERLSPQRPQIVTLRFAEPHDEYHCPQCGALLQWPEVSRSEDEMRERARSRWASEEAAKARARSEAAKDAAATPAATPEKPLQSVPKPSAAEVPFIRDSRPNAPAPINGHGSVVWFGNGSPR
jgi:hypothetical protein